MLGLPLELVPERAPQTLRKDRKLPFRLLRQGKPVKDVLVTALRRDAPERKVSARTDARGRVELRLEGSRPWLVKAVHVSRGEGPRDWSSLWASLTLETP